MKNRTKIAVVCAGGIGSTTLLARMANLGLSTNGLKTYEAIPQSVKNKIEINRAGVPFSHVKELAEKTQVIIDVNNDFRKIEPFLLIHKERYLQINAIPSKANKEQAFIEFLKQITELNGIKIKYFFKVLRKLKNYYEEN